MVTARPINVERALVDPRAVFKEPIEVLACADLDAAHKRQILSVIREASGQTEATPAALVSRLQLLQLVGSLDAPVRGSRAAEK
jgi:hypothetical protein